MKLRIALCLQVAGAVSLIVAGFCAHVVVGFVVAGVLGLVFGIALEREVDPAAVAAPVEPDADGAGEVGA